METVESFMDNLVVFCDCDYLYWQLCGHYLIILITSKKLFYRTLLRIDYGRELITKRKIAKRILKVP